MLIADGVDVGKTIEAGLILRELQARRDIRSILIICPRPLITEIDLDGEWPEEHKKAIMPYSLFDERLACGQYGADQTIGVIAEAQKAVNRTL